MDAQTIGTIEGGVIGIILILLIGAIAGWLAGLIMKGKGMGFLVNAILGIVGAFVGSFIFIWFNLPLFIRSHFLYHIVIRSFLLSYVFPRRANRKKVNYNVIWMHLYVWRSYWQ